MKKISTLLAAMLLSGIVGASCAPQKPYSPEEWQRRQAQWVEYYVEQHD